MAFFFNGFSYMPKRPSDALCTSVGVINGSWSSFAGIGPCVTGATILIGQSISAGYIGMLGSYFNPGVSSLIALRSTDTGTDQVIITINAYGGVTITSNGVVLGSTPAATINTQALNYLELGFRISGAGDGFVTLRCNGTTLINVTGVNTRVNSDTVGAIFPNLFFVRDIYAVSADDPPPLNTFLGRVKTVFLPAATAAGATQWTATPAGTPNAAAASAGVYDDSRYVSATTVGQQDLYTLPPNLGPWTVLGVRTRMAARQDDATQRAVETVLVSGAATVEEGGVGCAQTYAIQSGAVHTTDPATGQGWLYQAVNALLVGPKVTA